MKKYIARRGAETRSYRFTLKLNELKFADTVQKGPIRIVWTRGIKVAKTSLFQINDNKEYKSVFFDQALVLVSSMFFQDGQFVSKKSKLEIFQHIKDKGPVRIGKINFNLADKISEDSKNEEMVFSEKWRDCVSLNCRFTSRHIKELNPVLKERKNSTGRKNSSAVDNVTNPFTDDFAGNLCSDNEDTWDGDTMDEKSTDDFHKYSSSDLTNYPAAGGEKNRESLLNPPSLDGIDADNKKVQAFIAYYESHFAKLKKQIVKLQGDLQNRSEYASRLEVDLVNKKIELVNAVDQLHDLELENSTYRKELGIKDRTKIETSDNLFV